MMWRRAVVVVSVCASAMLAQTDRTTPARPTAAVDEPRPAHARSLAEVPGLPVMATGLLLMAVRQRAHRARSSKF
jgi:hypothetical protein